MDTNFVAREQSRLLGELSSFLSIPSVSALPSHAVDCRRAAEWLRDELGSLGCPTVQLVEGNGHPVVWAESPHVPDRPTLLIYGRPSGNNADHTQVRFWTNDISKDVKQLVEGGVVFDEYDTETFKTVDLIVTSPIGRSAWFKDPDGNTIALFQPA